MHSTFIQEVENIKNQLQNSVRITMLRAADSQQQCERPPFLIYLGGDEEALDKSYDTLRSICQEKNWKIERIGHRDVKIDPDPKWKYDVCKCKI